MVDAEVIAKIRKQLQRIIDHNLLVLVEGIKDKRALASLGIKRTMTLSRKPLYAVVEKVAETEKKVVLLMDLDSGGKKLYVKLRPDLISHGVLIDNRLRNLLFRETTLKEIEGLATFLGAKY